MLASDEKLEAIRAILTDGPVPVELSAATITIGEVDQGAKGDAATDAWYTQLVTDAGAALLARQAAAGSIPVVLSTEDAAKVPALGRAAAAASSPVALSTEDAAKVPALGRAAAAASTPVALSTEDAAVAAETHAVPGAAAPAKGEYALGVDGSGNARGMRTNASGICQTMPGLGTRSDSSAFEASRVFSASACEPSSLRCFSKAGGSEYAMLFNATSLPANGAIAAEQRTAGTNNTVVFTWASPTGRFGTGLVGGLSTTAASLTIDASANGLWQCDFFPVTT